MQSSVSALVLAAFFALAGPPPAPPPATHVQSTQISAPTGLKSTLDQKTCNDHGGFAGGLACKAGLPNGMLALVWNYCSGCQADGFHLYRVDGGRRDAVSIPANGTSVTIALLDVPSDGFSGKCYAVTAYRGSAESALSAQFCVAGGSTIQTVSLTPQHSRMSSKTATAGSNCLSPGVTGEGSSTKVFSVGYYHYVDPHNDCDWHNSVDRSAFYFDVASIVHKTISSAHLHLRVAWTSVYNGSPGKNYDFKNMLTDHSTSCVDSIGVGREYWWEYEDWIAGDVVGERRLELRHRAVRRIRTDGYVSWKKPYQRLPQPQLPDVVRPLGRDARGAVLVVKQRSFGGFSPLARNEAAQGEDPGRTESFGRANFGCRDAGEAS